MNSYMQNSSRSNPNRFNGRPRHIPGMEQLPNNATHSSGSIQPQWPWQDSLQMLGSLCHLTPNHWPIRPLHPRSYRHPHRPRCYLTPPWLWRHHYCCLKMINRRVTHCRLNVHVIDWTHTVLLFFMTNSMKISCHWFGKFGVWNDWK